MKESSLNSTFSNGSYNNIYCNLIKRMLYSYVAAYIANLPSDMPYGDIFEDNYVAIVAIHLNLLHEMFASLAI